MYPFKVQLILFSGKQGSGKDTIAAAVLKEVQRELGAVAKLMKFAGPLYEMHHAVMDVAMKYKMFKTKPVKDGKLLQVLGTEWGRTVNENIWVDAFVKSCDLVLHDIYIKLRSQIEVTKVVIMATDCRFENEFNCTEGALKVRLECPEEVRKSRAESWRDATDHPSETSLDQYADDGKFDLYLQTDEVDVIGCATLVKAQLDKLVWMEKRDNFKRSGDVK